MRDAGLAPQIDEDANGPLQAASAGITQALLAAIRRLAPGHSEELLTIISERFAGHGLNLLVQNEAALKAVIQEAAREIEVAHLGRDNPTQQPAAAVGRTNP
eukprot:12754406-Heterocapsa_arctica.AAC.1